MLAGLNDNFKLLLQDAKFDNQGREKGSCVAHKNLDSKKKKQVQCYNCGNLANTQSIKHEHEYPCEYK